MMFNDLKLNIACTKNAKHIVPMPMPMTTPAPKINLDFFHSFFRLPTVPIELFYHHLTFDQWSTLDCVAASLSNRSLFRNTQFATSISLKLVQSFVRVPFGGRFGNCYLSSRWFLIKPKCLIYGSKRPNCVDCEKFFFCFVLFAMSSHSSLLSLITFWSFCISFHFICNCCETRTLCADCYCCWCEITTTTLFPFWIEWAGRVVLVRCGAATVWAIFIVFVHFFFHLNWSMKYRFDLMGASHTPLSFVVADSPRFLATF